MVWKPDPKKVDIIIKMPSPQNKTGLASFLGMCNYLSSYIPHLSDVTAIFRQLNKKRTEFTWNHTYEWAFRKAKLHVANALNLKYFDPAKSIILECDASGTAVGGRLIQDGHPTTFVSQALKETLLKHWEGNLSCCGHCRENTSLCIWPQICHSHRPFTISESVSEMSEWHIALTTMPVTVLKSVPNGCPICYTKMCAHSWLYVQINWLKNRDRQPKFESSNCWHHNGFRLPLTGTRLREDT